MKHMIVMLAAATAALYLVAAFVAWDVNPGHWASRDNVAIAWAVIASLLAGWCVEKGYFEKTAPVRKE